MSLVPLLMVLVVVLAPASYAVLAFMLRDTDTTFRHSEDRTAT